MKHTFLVLLLLGAGVFAFSKDKVTAKSPPLFCIDSESKSVQLSDAESASAVESCNSVKSSDRYECAKKAARVLCRSKSGAKPLFGELNEIPNNLNCAEFANRFLEKRGLGNLKKPSALVTTKEPASYSKSGLPTFQFNMSGDPKTAVYASSGFSKETQEETWTLAVVATKNVPSFEPGAEMTPAVKSELNDRILEGEYHRWYRFRAVNNVCVLDKVDVEFTPKAPKGEQNSVKYRKSERILTQRECAYASPQIHGENFHKSFRVRQGVDILDPWICNESIASFNQPEKASVGANTKRNARGDQTAGRAR